MKSLTYTFLDALSDCVAFATAILGRRPTFDEWNYINRHLTTFRKRHKKTTK